MEWVLGGAAAAALLGLFALLSWRFDTPDTTFGSSGWLSVFTAFRNGLFRERGMLVGDWAGILPVYYDGTHAITFGSAGSGKGTTAILPNLLHGRFLFVVDPGGENVAVAIRQWRRRGFDVYVINPFGMFTQKPWDLPSDSFNPLNFIDPASATFAADAKVLAEILTPRTGRESGSGTYFMNRAESWLLASIVHLKTTEPAARQNLRTLYSWVHLDAGEWKALLAAMKANKAVHGLVRHMAVDMERMQKQADAEFSAVLSTVQDNLAWLAEPLAAAAVRRSDVDFSALKGLKGEKGAVIAVVMPLDFKETHKAIPRLALQSAIWHLQREPHASGKVLFEIDETASLGRLERLPQWLAELRKYGVQWSLQFQNVGQAKFLYEKEWQTFQGNAGLKRFLATGDSETAREASEFTGRMTISVPSYNSNGGTTISLTGRELVMPDEVIRMSRGRMLVIYENLRPMLLNKTPYWNRREFQGRYHPNPYFAGMKERDPGIWRQELWGRIVYAAAWWLTPHPTAAWIILAATALSGLWLYGKVG